MSDDIVTRLRRDVSGVEYMPHVTDPQGFIVWDAADEIEDLRSELQEFQRQYAAMKADRDRWAKWGEHVFLCPNKGVNPCRDCVSPATADAMSRVDRGGAW